MPYWYFHGLGSPFRDHVMESVDPGGRLSAALPPRRAIGCVVYPAVEVVEPGVVEHLYGDRFTLGEPDGTRSPWMEALSQAMIATERRRCGRASAMSCGSSCGATWRSTRSRR